MALQRQKPGAIGIKAPFPGFIEPVLAEQVDRVPRGERWIHEIKFDGYRGQLHIANHDIKIFTRNGSDWTKRFRKVAHDADLISASSANIDGEIVAPGEDGKTDFATLQSPARPTTSV
ncbi:bifunctional non-homologous end joining protein LigD [Bradyrhizobium sp. Rc2d]|nr:bifunctional non-homologous end joining protein LigD [Bradyrhizobium sp. Rc2d]